MAGGEEAKESAGKAQPEKLYLLARVPVKSEDLTSIDGSSTFLSFVVGYFSFFIFKAWFHGSV